MRLFAIQSLFLFYLVLVVKSHIINTINPTNIINARICVNVCYGFISVTTKPILKNWNRGSLCPGLTHYHRAGEITGLI